jgi:hypothetical protein
MEGMQESQQIETTGSNNGTGAQEDCDSQLAERENGDVPRQEGMEKEISQRDDIVCDGERVDIGPPKASVPSYDNSNGQCKAKLAETDSDFYPLSKQTQQEMKASGKQFVEEVGAHFAEAAAKDYLTDQDRRIKAVKSKTEALIRQSSGPSVQLNSGFLSQTTSSTFLSQTGACMGQQSSTGVIHSEDTSRDEHHKGSKHGHSPSGQFFSA